MKLSLPSNNADPANPRPVRAEVVASEGGRSLLLVNGRPVPVAGEFAAGQQLNGRLAATAGGFSIIAADNSEGVSAEKLLQNAGLHENGPQLAAAMKSYGVPVNAENLRLAAELLKQLPRSAANPELVALLLARKLPAAAAPLLQAYLAGRLQAAGLFAALDRTGQTALQNAWGRGRLTDTLLQMFAAGKTGDAATLRRLAAGGEEWVAGLQLQEMLSILPERGQEGRIYFQWPMFWHDQDVPDTLEGEAFVPDSSDQEQGFSLRLLVNPPAFGQVEVALHLQQKTLWIHFGVAEEHIDLFKSIFTEIRTRVLAGGDFDQVRLTIGKVRLLNNFFSTSTEPPPIPPRPKLDLKA